MATIEAETEITACDICGAAIDPEDQRLLRDDLEVTIGYLTDLMSTARVEITGLDTP